jgi:hypothetical protein
VVGATNLEATPIQVGYTHQMLVRDGYALIVDVQGPEPVRYVLLVKALQTWDGLLGSRPIHISLRLRL